MVEDREHEDVDRQQDEETVAETAESLLTFENAALALSVVSPEGNVIMANRAMRDLLGYEFSDLIGKSVYELVVADPSEVARFWAERIHGGDRVMPEQAVRVRCANGSEVSVRVSSVLVTDDRGAAHYVVARAVAEPT